MEVNESKVKTDFIHFFMDTAHAKLQHKVNVIKFILHTVPEIKRPWKDFKMTSDFSLDDVASTHKGLQMQEYRFLNFIMADGLSTQYMWRVIEAADQLVTNMNPAYNYTQEELEYLALYSENKELYKPMNKITRDDVDFIKKSNRR